MPKPIRDNEATAWVWLPDPTQNEEKSKNYDDFVQAIKDRRGEIDEPNIGRTGGKIDELYVDSYHSSLEISATTEFNTLLSINTDLSVEDLERLRKQINKTLDKKHDSLFGDTRVVDANKLIKEFKTTVNDDGRISVGKGYAGKHIRVVVIDDEKSEGDKK